MSGGGKGGHAKGGHRKHKGGHDEEHENHERWLVSYADMMTLLMVLFIVMFAISQVDQKKFAELKNGLAVGFGSPSTTFDGGQQTLIESSDTDSPMDLSTGIGGSVNSPANAQLVKDAISAQDRVKAARQQAAAKREVEDYKKIEEKINASMKAQGLTDAVRFTIDERGRAVPGVTSSVAFAGGEAVLLSAGQHILDGIGPAIAPLPN